MCNMIYTYLQCWRYHSLVYAPCQTWFANIDSSGVEMNNVDIKVAKLRLNVLKYA